MKSGGPLSFDRAHVDTCLWANTHVFPALMGEDVRKLMPNVEEACSVAHGCAMFKRSEVAFHRNAQIPELAQLLKNPYLQDYEFEVCLPQTSCLEEEPHGGAVVFSPMCRYNEETGIRNEWAVAGVSNRDTVYQGCKCGLHPCIDQCVNADTTGRETIECAYYCQNELTKRTRNWLGDFVCEAKRGSGFQHFDEVAVRMTDAHNEAVKADNKGTLYNTEKVRKEGGKVFYDCVKADSRPSQWLAKALGVPNLIGNLMYKVGLTNKYD